MRVHVLPLALSTLLVTLPAFAVVGVTGELDPVNDELVVRDAQLDASEPTREVKRKRKAVRKSIKILGKPNVARSYRHEVKAGAKVAKTFDKLLADEVTLGQALEAAGVAYLRQLGEARGEIEAAAAIDGLSKKARNKLERSAAKVGRFVDAAGAATTQGTRFKNLAKAAKVAGRFAGGEKQTVHWVVSELRVAPLERGADFDGDGAPDNFLAGLQGLLFALGQNVDVNQTLADGLTDGPDFLMIEMWSIDSFASDPFVFTGLLTGIDQDDDPSDNFTGTEGFVADAATIGPDGHATARAGSPLDRGAYSVDLGGSEIMIGGFQVPQAGKLQVSGTASVGANTGVIAFAVPTQTLLDLFEQAGVVIPANLIPLLTTQADIDLNGDGTKDGFSGALTFSAVPAELVQDN